MSRAHPRPRRSLRSELVTLLSVFALPVALALVFPYWAVGFRAALPASTAPSCAFVTLDGDGEAKAMERVHSAFLSKADLVCGHSAELSLSTLPETPPVPVVTLDDRVSVVPMRPIAYAARPLPPTRAAAEPAPLPGRLLTPKPTFSKDELLHID